MAIEHAVEAYRQSAYQQLEYDIRASAGRASLPFVGGIWPGFMKTGNRIKQPFKVVGAWASGGDYPISDVTVAKIHDDLKDSRYGEALEKMREYGRESADQRAQSVGKLLSFNITGFFRDQRKASYNEGQMRHVILPDDGESGFDRMIASGAGLVANSMLSGSGLGSLGNLSPAIASRQFSASGVNV